MQQYKTFSLVIPSRERPVLLQECLTSFFSKAELPQLIEAIVIIDYDDKSYLDLLNYTQQNLNWDISLILKHRSEWQNRDNFCRGGRLSQGEFVWLLNDESEIINQNWDSLLYKKFVKFLEKKFDKILYCIVDDDSLFDYHEKNGGAFPILSKSLVECMGGGFPQEINHNCADTILYRIISQFPDRIVIDKGIKVLHKSHHTQRREKDNVDKRVSEISTKNGAVSELHQLDYMRYINNIKQKITLGQIELDLLERNYIYSLIIQESKNTI